MAKGKGIGFQGPRATRGGAPAPPPAVYPGTPAGRNQQQQDVANWRDRLAAQSTYRKQQLGGPPPGTYDPALDANVRASQRGLLDLRQDTRRNQLQSEQDYAIRKGQIGLGERRSMADIARTAANQQWTLGRNREQAGLGYQRGMQDIGFQRQDLGTQRGDIATKFGRESQDLATRRSLAQQAFDRGIADLGTQRDRAGGDYQTGLANLARNYSLLGARQTEAARAAGVDTGGALQASAAARAANQAHDQAPLDTGYQRFVSDAALREQRARQDFGTQTGELGLAGQRLTEDQARANAGLDTAGHRLDIGQGRLTQDYGTQQQGFAHAGSVLAGQAQVARRRLGENVGQQLGQLGLSEVRATEQRQTGLGRGIREQGFYAADVERQKAFQSKMWNPDTQPHPGGRPKPRVTFHANMPPIPNAPGRATVR